MKQAHIHFKLSKDQQVYIKDVTPIQLLYLVAEHHKNCGGTPIDPSDIHDVHEVTRTNDQEFDRLRHKYSAKKLNAILQQIRDLPTDFPDAIKRGTTIAMPTGSLAEVKII
jgi:hypothetical protein